MNERPKTKKWTKTEAEEWLKTHSLHIHILSWGGAAKKV